MDPEEEQISEELPEGMHPVDEEGEIIIDDVVVDDVDPLAPIIDGDIVDPLLPKDNEHQEEIDEEEADMLTYMEQNLWEDQM